MTAWAGTSMGECSVDDCTTKVRCRGLCGRHYAAARKAGDCRPLSATERFWAKVDKTEGCWLWSGALTNEGYGSITVDGSHVYAHRFSYELMVGPIDEGLHVDHLCSVRNCVRPEHLEPVTPRENFLRNTHRSSVAHRTDVCQRGHEFTPENTYVVPSTGNRRCRECIRITFARWQQSKLMEDGTRLCADCEAEVR